MDLFRALEKTHLRNAGIVLEYEVHNSRSRARAFSVKLTAPDGGADYNGRLRRPMMFSDDRRRGATYDEWGRFLQRLFEYDPHARAMPAYPEGMADFNYQHGDKYKYCSRMAR